MKKQKKSLFILILILVLIGAAFAGIKIFNKNAPAEEEKISYSVTETEPSLVSEFIIVNESGSFSFTKEGDIWNSKEEPDADIDEELLENSISAATAISSEDKIDEAADMKQYGLDNPQITVSFTADGEKTTLNIGDYNEAVSKYYLCVEGENTVYTIDDTVRSSFIKTLEDLKVNKTE